MPKTREDAIRDAIWPRWAFDPATHADADPDEIARSRAFIPAQLDRMAVPPTEDERADLERRLMAALFADFAGNDWLGVRERRPNEKGAIGDHVSVIPTAAAYERVWSVVFREWYAAHASAIVARASAIAARKILEAYRRNEDDKATHAIAEPRLTAEVEKLLPGMLESIGDTEGDEARERAVRRLNETGLGESAKSVATDYPPELWRDPIFVARLLAAAVWTCRLRDALPTALVPALVQRTIVNVNKGRRLQGELFHPKTGEVTRAAVFEIQDRDGTPLARYAPPPGLEASAIDPVVLRNLTTQKVLRWAVHAGWREKWINDNPLPWLLTVAGGWSGLATLLGMGTKKAADEVRESVMALCSLWIQTARTDGNILAAENRRIGRRHELEIHLMGPLRPGYVTDELRDEWRAVEKKLVPFSRQLPPMVGRANEHGAIGALQWLTLAWMRQHAKDLEDAGGVLIDGKRWKVMADEAGVPSALLDDLREAWATGDKAAPAFLVPREADRFDLAPAYGNERKFLIQSARRERIGARGGRKVAMLLEGDRVRRRRR